MKLFIAQKAALNDADYDIHFSKVLDVFASYIRAPQRKTVEIISATDAELKGLNINKVSSETN